MKKLVLAVLSTVALVSTANAGRSVVKLSRYEVKNVMHMMALTDIDEFVDCRSDSDCGEGLICVGIGICVPESTTAEYKKLFPALLSPNRR
jgi:hypothetical protein